MEINFLILEMCFKSIRNAIPAPTAAALILAEVLSENETNEGFSSFNIECMTLKSDVQENCINAVMINIQI